MFFRKIFSSLALLSSVLLSAQTTSVLDRFTENVSISCVEIAYDYSVRTGGVNLSGEGTLVSQGMYWTLKGNGVEMYCDSTSLWVVDPSLKEVVIEPASTQTAGNHLVNPAILLVRMRELFDVQKSRSEGNGLVLYILRPKSESDLEYLNVEMSESDAAIRTAVMAMNDGSLINIKVSSMKLTPLRSVEDFRPRTVFDRSWIVTDLR